MNILLLALLVPFMFHQVTDPFTTPILPCSRLITSFDQKNKTFYVEATTPIKSVSIVKASGSTSKPKIEGNKASVSMDIKDVYNFYIYLNVIDECDTWTPKMETLPR